MRIVLIGLWRHPEFVKLWAGQTISAFGSRVTALALPLTALLTLDASPLQLGLLGAMSYLPFLLIGLLAGAWVDRWPRRPVLIVADIGRALLLGSIPVTAVLGSLHIEQLLVVAFSVGVLTVFFDLAYVAFLPAVVGREHLVEGNSKLQLTQSAAQVAGPGTAGVLMQIVMVPIAIGVDAVSFLISAFFLRMVRAAEPLRRSGSGDRSIWREIGEGVRYVSSDPFQRVLTGVGAIANLIINFGNIVSLLFITRQLGMSAAMVGLVLAAGSGGLVVGAAITPRVTARLGRGTVIIGAPLILGTRFLCTLLAPPSLIFALPLVAVAYALGGFSSALNNVNQVSLRQAITPNHLLGRVNATSNFVSWGIIPVGSLLGGIAVGIVGSRLALVFPVAGALVASLLLLLSPVRTLPAVTVPSAAD